MSRARRLHGSPVAPEAPAASSPTPARPRGDEAAERACRRALRLERQRLSDADELPGPVLVLDYARDLEVDVEPSGRVVAVRHAGGR